MTLLRERAMKLAPVLSFVAVAFCAQLARADSLSSLTLPDAPKKPWRFSGFPISAWWGPPGTATQADFQAYKDAGFTLHATNMDTGFDQALLYVEAVGLKSLTLRQGGGFELPPRADPNPPTNRDSIVGWVTGDEPNGDAAVIPAITEVNRLMRDDPTRWTFFNMLPPNLQVPPGTAGVIDAAARNGMPIVSYDDYVILEDGSELTAQFYRNLGTVRAATLKNKVPFWAFAVTVAHTGYAGKYRRPSESDLRWMQYSNLAYGAKGLFYFTYWGASSLDAFSHVAIVSNTGEKSELYDMVSALNHAVLGVGDTLLQLTSVDVVHTRPPPGQTAFAEGARWIQDVQAQDALIGFFEDASGTPYALVVNKVHGKDKSAAAAADTLKLTFDPTVRSVDALSWLDGAKGLLAIQDGTASLTVAGGTGVLLKATLGDPPAEATPPAAAAGPPASSGRGCRASQAPPDAFAASLVVFLLLMGGRLRRLIARPTWGNW